MSMQRHAVLLVIAALLNIDTALAQEDALGRLFYTPAQRAALNANIRSVTEQSKKRIPVARTVTLSGVVTRSDGERTVWVDGHPYYQGNPDNVRVITNPGDPAAAELRVIGINKRIPVRVGQQLDPASGKTSEKYEMPRSSVQTQEQTPAARGAGAETASNRE